MVEIIRNPSIEQVYEVITQGFVDYYVDVTLTLDEFRERFFDFDKNELRYSAVALEGDEVVGAILGGVKQYGEETVFRCGALAIIPAHRKHGVGQLLLDDQEELVAELGATHILEVIQANEPALAFYKKNGFRVLRDIHYFTSPKHGVPSESKWQPASATDFEELLHGRPFWQHDAYAAEARGASYYRFEDEGKYAVVAMHGNKILNIVANTEDGRFVAWGLSQLGSELELALDSERPLAIKLHQMGWNVSSIRQHEMVKEASGEE
ncbi:GNAT family N-acetyltransferase [Paenalkalicoccus suaedae]|uniref:GNAT family N-acetyltransferase n=1 Tax=Paenalkalicoccus suaedae TaxID=2592382 RepID=A0A859FAS1_9BACI|nr:GNAT family N-acetyltransferase [Paenalkalicoccus suaedae]QKS69721.1 GNAT family N-acetyltransferase [Paenalkalicoccus suaedae]